MRIALFGGSFNPPHLGHILCALYAYKMAGLDEIWIMPSADHPYGKDLLAWEARWEMCQAAFEGMSFVQLKDDELRNEGGKTINLIKSLQEQHPGNEWFIVGGTDTIDDIPQWYHGQEILKLLEVIAIPRQGYDHGSTAALPAISSSLVRERLAKGAVVDDLVPLGVEQLIARHAYYAPSIS